MSTYSKTTVEDARIEYTGPEEDYLVADSGGVVLFKVLAPPEAIGRDESTGRPGTFVVHVEYTPNAEGVLTWDESQRDKRRLEASREMLDILKWLLERATTSPMHPKVADGLKLVAHIDGKAG